MLDLENIISYVPEKLRGFKKNILREYLQYKILEIIFDTNIGAKMVFVGGTSLRVIYGTERFSEDLDFDNFALSLNEFKGILGIVKDKLQLDGYEIKTDIDLENQAWHNYIYFPALLFKSGLSSHENERFMIKLDTQPHSFKYEPNKELINNFGVTTYINVAPIDILLSQKIKAFFSRKHGRDLYDIAFLLSKTKPNYQYLHQFLNISSSKNLKEKLISRCDELNFKKLETDLQRLVFDSTEVKKVKLFREIINDSEL